ncbi:hypothetical protein PIROE2DRAFT_15317 [Piromyces sp. E2]|nr:hypothetical protein PIROE2DRAFT_15317 [Piromyces sp. E2]|eukprot:OUM59222.1 hypothetical protein PIROE2DRAFT_15317 [Piromyces sp. E2]
MNRALIWHILYWDIEKSFPPIKQYRMNLLINGCTLSLFVKCKGDLYYYYYYYCQYHYHH